MKLAVTYQQYNLYGCTIIIRIVSKKSMNIIAIK